MKFLVLALCVCAASAASFGSFSGYRGYQNPVAAPAVFAAKATAQATAPVVAPVVKAAEVAYTVPKNVVVQSVKEADAIIERADSQVSPDGQYNYGFQTSNGINVEAVGALKQTAEGAVVVSQGSYGYVAPDGTPVLMTYTADENGYQPKGDLIPVGPPVPEDIARALAYIAARTAKNTV